MNLEAITPLLITYNEEANLTRTLKALAWAKQIVVIDSFSTDQTLPLLRKDPRVLIFQRTFDSFAQQCSYGVEKVSTPWVLSLDADYIVSKALVEEFRSIEDSDEIEAYEISFRLLIHGRILKASLYPPRIVFFRKGSIRYENDGHGHRAVALDRHSALRSPIIHDDRKPMSRWLKSQKGYASQEAQKITSSPFKNLPFQDKLRALMVPAPFAVIVYCLLVKGLLFEGVSGWVYTAQRAFVECLLSGKILMRHLKNLGFSKRHLESS
ncbi:MAG: glycosyltransferase family 2 protein [Verrucomicrobiota bacterium]